MEFEQFNVCVREGYHSHFQPEILHTMMISRKKCLDFWAKKIDERASNWKAVYFVIKSGFLSPNVSNWKADDFTKKMFSQRDRWKCVEKESCLDFSFPSCSDVDSGRNEVRRICPFDVWTCWTAFFSIILDMKM